MVLIFILLIIAVVLRLNIRLRTITVHYPTLNQYRTIPNDAQCSCSHIAVPYSAFVKLEITFHQVCSSDFISDRWITTINLGSSTTNLYYTDFRIMASAQFQALASFCHLSKENIVQGISTFNQSLLYSLKLLSENLFQSQTKSDIEQFQLTLPNTFRTQLQLLRQITFNNQLISGLQTNFYMMYSLNNHSSPHLMKRSFVYRKYDDSYCLCSKDINCASLSGIYADFQQIWLFQVPGILSGCLPIDSLLLSTLICFYNQTCIDNIISYYRTKKTFTAMSVFKKSQYRSNSTIQSMINQLMIEEWITDVSYEKYYLQCAPISCIYTIFNRYNFVFIFTKLIGSLTALTLILKLLIPLVLKLIKRLRKKNPNRPRIPCKFIPESHPRRSEGF